MHTDTWYELETSRESADDWFRAGEQTWDSVNAARHAAIDAEVSGFQIRIVRVTQTREAL